MTSKGASLFGYTWINAGGAPLPLMRCTLLEGRVTIEAQTINDHASNGRTRSHRERARNLAARVA